MGLDCKICNGERELPAWYVNDAKEKCSFHYDVCLCTGKTDHGVGERKVSKEEHDRLKLKWEKPIPPEDQSFQVAA